MLEQNYARRAERRAVDITCEVVASQWDEPLMHRAQDLSPFGMWLRTGLPLEIGNEVVLCFKPPRGLDCEELNVFARVQRVERRHHSGDRSGMGLEFIDMTRAQRRVLQGCLRNLPAARRVRSGAPKRHDERKSRRAFR